MRCQFECVGLTRIPARVKIRTNLIIVVSLETPELSSLLGQLITDSWEIQHMLSLVDALKKLIRNKDSEGMKCRRFCKLLGNDDIIRSVR